MKHFWLWMILSFVFGGSTFACVVLWILSYPIEALARSISVRRF